MCSLLTAFLVVGSYELSPGIMYVEILNQDSVVEEFIVPEEQYKKCSDVV